MRDDDECALFHALYPVTGGAVTDAPRVTRTDEPVPIEVLGSHGAIGPMRSHCAMGPRPTKIFNGTNGPNGSRNAGRGGETRFGMFLFGHWIAHARVRGPYVDITFDPHSHEVAELLGAKLAPARLASLLALVLARCPDVARATRARRADRREVREADRREVREADRSEEGKTRKAREADRSEEGKARKAREARKSRSHIKGREARKNRNARDACEAREADRREEGESESEDTELVMLTDLAGPTDAPDLSGLSGLTDLSSVGLSDLTGLSDLADLSALARVQVVVFSSHGSRGPNGPNGLMGANGPNGPMGAFGTIGASVKWARVVSWDTDSLARLAFHVDVRIIKIEEKEKKRTQ